MIRHRSLLIAVLLVAGGAHRASAAVAVGMEILQDGKHVAGFTITHRGESEAEIWLKMKDIRLTFARDFAIPVDAEDSAKATLTGSIKVRTRCRGEPGTGIVTDHLQLVRRSSLWYVVDADVDRTLKAAGLKVPAQATTPATVWTEPLWAVALCLSGLVVAAVVLLIIRRGTRAE